MRRATWPIALGAGLVVGGCRSAAATGDAGIDAIDADVTPVSQGVAIGVFGAPGPEDGVPAPVFFIGCPKTGLAAVQMYTLEVDGSVLDRGTGVATFTRTAAHDHVAIGTSLVTDLDELGADPNRAPFIYKATVTSDPDFYLTSGHTFAAHLLNPAMPTFDNLGAWNMDTLVSCP